MFGQGSPNFHRCLCRCSQRRHSNACRYRCALRWRIYIAFVLAIVFAPTFPSNQTALAAPQDSRRLGDAEAEAPSDLKLRFAWGGGVPQKWQGKLEIENGAFTDSRVLAITSDAPSTVVKRGGELSINHRIATSYGGVDASIELSDSTKVRIELNSPSGETFERTWTLAQLITGVNESIDEHQNRISVSRTPGDKIRVDVNRPHLVFEPGETWRFKTKLQRYDVADQNVAANFSWKNGNIRLPASIAPVQFTTNENGTSNAETVEVTVPTEEGAHDLWIECQSPASKSTFGQFLRPKTIARRVQIVVISKTAPDPGDVTTWNSIETLSAQQLRGSFRTPWPVPRLPGSKEPIRKGDLSLVSIPDPESESAVELAAGTSLTIPVPTIAGGPIPYTAWTPA